MMHACGIIAYLLSSSVHADIIINCEVFCDETIFCANKIHDLFHRALLKTGKHLNVCPSDACGAHVTIVWMTDVDIRSYNAQYRQKNQATNVLAFPTVEKTEPWCVLPGHPILLGDIFISLETVIHEAHTQGKSLHDHAMHILLHGFLHLLHYDHQNDADAQEMEGIERAIFHEAGWPDPYFNTDSVDFNTHSIHQEESKDIHSLSESILHQGGV